MHEYERIALEKLDLCRLLDILYVNMHDSFMDYYNYNLSMSGSK
jgi:L-arabinose isomerase